MAALGALATLVALPAPARATEPRVTVERSYWNERRTLIYSDVVVEHTDGRVERRRVPGGKVDRIRMVQVPLVVKGATGPREFVRLQTSGATPVRWESSCVYITPDAAGTTDLDGDRETQIIKESLRSWEAMTASCAYLRFVIDAPAPHEVGLDGVNVVKFREDTWCRPPADKDDPPDCHDRLATAITTLFYIDDEGEPDDGAILDADIEMNAVHFAMAECDGNGTCTTNGQGLAEDVANTLMHEFGHLLGLEHTCWDGNDTKRTDHLGNPVPSCFPESSLPPSVTEATMYNFQESGEIAKRTLEPDDVAGFCAIYPRADDPGFCERVDITRDSGWCGVVDAPAPRGGAGPGAGALLAAALGALALRRPWSRRRAA